MNVSVYLEPTEKNQLEEEQIIEELEKKSRFQAVQKSGRAPSMTELLYHVSEDDMLALKDVI